MRAVSLILLLIFTAQLGFSQCKLKIDEFTRDSSIFNKMDRVAHNFDLKGTTLRWAISWYSGIYLLSIESSHSNIVSSDKFDTTYVKLTNGDVLKFYNDKYKIAKPISGNGITLWFLSQNFVLDDPTLRSLEENDIDKIRVKHQEYKVKSSGNKDIKNQIECLKRTLAMSRNLK